MTSASACPSSGGGGADRPCLGRQTQATRGRRGVGYVSPVGGGNATGRAEGCVDTGQESKEEEGKEKI
jgi:hypothetical protein